MAITLGFSAGAVLGLVADEPDRSAAMAVPLSSSVARPAAKSTAARFIETSCLLGKHARFTGDNPAGMVQRPYQRQIADTEIAPHDRL